MNTVNTQCDCCAVSIKELLAREAEALAQSARDKKRAEDAAALVKQEVEFWNEWCSNTTIEAIKCVLEWRQCMFSAWDAAHPNDGMATTLKVSLYTTLEELHKNQTHQAHKRFSSVYLELFGKNTTAGF